MNSGFEKILGGLKAREDLKEKLKELPFRREQIPASELAALVEIKSQLNDFIRRYELSAQEGKSEEIKPRFFNEIVRYLDGLPVWKYKFTTDSGDDSRRLQFDPEHDSIYYLTGTGVSLRLKKANLLEWGVRKVVSSFADSVYFIDDDNKISQEPREGSLVREYITNEFHMLQNGGSIHGDFVSPIKYHFDKDGSIKYVEPPEKVHHYHEGHAVNKLIFEK